MISLTEMRSFLAAPDEAQLEMLFHRSSRLTRQYFGRDIAIYTPLYLDNHCDSGCSYCGFNRRRDIERQKLTLPQIADEMEVISGWGIDHVLLLTGESPQSASLQYLLESVQLARTFFSAVTLEVYPLEEEEYRRLACAGADGIVLFQETYDPIRYRQLHPCGRKADFKYRIEAPERMARAGIHRLTLGVLLGLADVVADLHALFSHLEELQRRYPGIEYQLAFPRLVPLAGEEGLYHPVSDTQLLAAIALARLLFPRVSISLSTREPEALRDAALEIGTTRISAGSRTGVGGYASGLATPVQFSIHDRRSVAEIIVMLKAHGLCPVFTDWLSLEETDAGRISRR